MTNRQCHGSRQMAFMAAADVLERTDSTGHKIRRRESFDASYPKSVMAVDMFSGKKFDSRSIQNLMDVHRCIAAVLPGVSLDRLIPAVVPLPVSELCVVLGTALGRFSARTASREKLSVNFGSMSSSAPRFFVRPIALFGYPLSCAQAPIESRRHRG